MLAPRSTPNDKPAAKMFQKPNILRKRPIGKTQPAPVASEDVKVSVQPELQTQSPSLIRKHKCSKPSHSIRKPVQRIQLDSYICEEYRNRKLQDSLLNTLASTSVSNMNNNVEDNVKVEITDNRTGETKIQEITLLNPTLVKPEPREVGLDLPEYKILLPLPSTEEVTQPDATVKASNEINIEIIEGDIAEGASSLKESMIVHMDGAGSMMCPQLTCRQTFLTADSLIQHLNTHSTKVYMCKRVGCDAAFTSLSRLRRHRASHGEPTRPAIECPARRSQPPQCGRTFTLREDLLAHLKEDHTPEDAPYCCSTCNRHFFWLSGLRAHARAHASRGVVRARTLHACPWPGCGRVFLQACRLREHSRAHTGDKPYACKHPNCSWSFRTASKLVRHARRHTGERRHTCVTCSRAFLRAEHLREHAARHAPAPRTPTHICTHPGCGQAFNNKSTLYTHKKKIHKSQKKSHVEMHLIGSNTYKYMISEMFHIEECEDSELRAARTHCTWPLASARLEQAVRAVLPPCEPEPEPEPELLLQGLDSVQVELENSESNNVYTVRSDLFLHGGNLLHADDSQQGCILRASAGAAGQAEGTELVLLEPEQGLDQLHLEQELGLLDSTSTIDLMQQEMMYGDSAVDESSFQVLLLSGDSINT